MRTLLLALALLLPTEPLWAEEKKKLFFYLQGNPLGLAGSYEVEHTLSPALSVANNTLYSVYALSSEVGLRYRYLGGFLQFDLLAGSEFGFYQELGFGDTPPVNEAEGEEIPRDFGMKGWVRAEGFLNLKLPRVWLYGRASPTLRVRDHTEFDARRAIAVQDELSFGYAGALLVQPTRPKTLLSGKKQETWLYVEWTEEIVRRLATKTLEQQDESVIGRPSAGVIAYAPLGKEKLSLNLDVYYSLLKGLDGELKGLGAQLLVYWDL